LHNDTFVDTTKG